MEKIFIIDAINFLFRSYYAIGPMTNPQGQSTSALYGFIRSMQKMLKDFSPEHLVCVFDGQNNKKHRQELYAAYKAHREKGPEDLYPQIPLAIEYCKKAGLPVLSIDNYEADDVMASVCTYAKSNHITSYLCTSDKDLMQLIDDNTFVLNVHKNNLILDKHSVVELFGVRPDQMLDLLALMGDASDNIPGVEGIGPKTAATLLQKYTTLDQILEKAEEIGGKKGQTLLAQKERAFLSKKLATLVPDVPIPTNDSFYKIQKGDLLGLKALFQEMRFLTLLNELEPQPPSLEKGEGKIEYTLVDTEEKLAFLCKKLLSQKQIVLDIHASSAHPLGANLLGIALCYEMGKAYYIPYVQFLDAKIINSYLHPVFASCPIIGHDTKFALHVLTGHAIPIKTIYFDTMIAAYLLHPQNRKYSLDHIVLEIFEKKIPPFIATLLPTEESFKDHCEKVDYIFRLKEYYSKHLQEKNLETLFYEVEIPLIPILAKMEAKGIFLDSQKLTNIAKELLGDLQILEAEIYQTVGKSFNINSPKQLGEVLYQDLGLPQSRKKGAQNSTAAPILEELAKDNPFVAKILEYRGLEKLRSTYTQSLVDQVNLHTHRVHCTFNQTVAATGRLSCQDPNLQNIPIRSEKGRKIREGFKPQKEGWKYLSFDYSQIELRLLAHFSNDPILVNAFTKNEDVHVHTASILFDLPLEKITKEMRSSAKTVNFGLLYGQGPYGLSQQLGISTKEASSFIEIYFTRYKGVKQYFDQCIEEARSLGYVKTILGRIRPLGDINSKNIQIRNAAERLAINSPLQGSNADIIKKAMITIDREIANLKGFAILQIHDELLFEVPSEEVDIFTSLVKEKMENVYPLRVPLLVEIAIGKNWGEC